MLCACVRACVHGKHLCMLVRMCEGCVENNAHRMPVMANHVTRQCKVVCCSFLIMTCLRSSPGTAPIVRDR